MAKFIEMAVSLVSLIRQGGASTGTIKHVAINLKTTKFYFYQDIVGYKIGIRSF